MIIPTIINVDDNVTPADSPQNIPFNINSSIIDKSHITKIKLRSDWAIVAGHPVFKREYKDYIRKF
jgi:hypothetical protein